jgi:hypothetical protein
VAPGLTIGTCLSEQSKAAPRIDAENAVPTTPMTPLS